MEKAFLFVDVRNPTWQVYAGLLVFAVFFRFSRVMSVRNLDLTLILLLSTSLVVSGLIREQPVADGVSLVASTEKPDHDARAADVNSSGDEVAGNSALAEAVVSDPTGVDSNPVEAGSVPPTAQAVPTSKVSVASMMLFGLSILLLVRLVLDEGLTRRPRLDQNLNQAGLTFLCIPAFLLPMVGVFIHNPSNHSIKAVEHGMALLERREPAAGEPSESSVTPAPTETLIAAGGTVVAQLSGNRPDDSAASEGASFERWLARVLIVVAHTMVVLGLLHIGRHHFSSLQLGLSMSCLYLLLPCTAVKVHELNQVVPAACLIWAISSYRNPIVSGVLLGLASGTLFFAAFLLPLWAVFYGRRGGVKFLVSVLGVAAVLISCLMLTSGDANSFVNKLVTTANWSVYRLLDDTVTGADASLSQLFIRIPMAAIFFVMLTAMTVIPRPRNLENLLANSTALIVSAQMWYPDDIGTYVLWYLPLFLLVIFRPRLDRFTPPEAVERQQASSLLAPSSPTTASSATVAMTRISLFR